MNPIHERQLDTFNKVNELYAEDSTLTLEKACNELNITKQTYYNYRKLYGDIDNDARPVRNNKSTVKGGNSTTSNRESESTTKNKYRHRNNVEIELVGANKNDKKKSDSSKSSSHKSSSHKSSSSSPKSSSSSVKSTSYKDDYSSPKSSSVKSSSGNNTKISIGDPKKKISLRKELEEMRKKKERI